MKKTVLLISALILLSVMLTTTASAQTENSPILYSISNFGDSYYYYGRTNSTFFNDAFDITKISGWTLAKTAIGFGSPASGTGLRLATTLAIGPESYQRGDPLHTWTYFKKTFELGENFNAATIVDVSGTHRIDDALVIFINGVEVYRYNTSKSETDVNIGTPINWGAYVGRTTDTMNREFAINSDYNQKSAGMGSDSPLFQAGSLTNLTNALKPGINVITCVVGQVSSTSGDIWFDLDMTIECEETLNSASYHYVAPYGSDTPSGGTLVNPWKTINYAVNRLKAGDTLIIREGIYNERVTVNVSGTVTDYITIKGEEGKRVILDGTGLNSNNGSNYMIRLDDRNYVRIENLEICNNILQVRDWNSNIGIYVNTSRTGNGSAGIQIVNNKIYNIDGETFHTQNSSDGGPNANGIHVSGYGSTDARAIRDILIEGNEVYGCKLGWSEAVVVNGNVRDWQIINNYIHDNNNIGIDAVGGEDWLGFSATDQLNRARNGRIAGNVIINSTGHSNQAYNGGGGADGIYVDGGKDIIIENNYVLGCGYGIEIGTEIGTSFRPSGIFIRNNVVSYNLSSGILLGGTDGALDVLVEKNTIYQTVGNGLERKSGSNTGPYDIKNNIIVTAGNISYISASGTGGTLNYTGNIYYGGSSSRPSGDTNGQVIATCPVVSLTSGNFMPNSDISQGAVLTALTTPDLAKGIANYAARLPALTVQSGVYSIINSTANKGSSSNPLTCAKIGGDNICRYFENLPGIAGTGAKVYMKHANTNGSSYIDSDSNADKYYGIVTIGNGADGQINYNKITQRLTITNMRIYVSVPYEANGQTSWIAQQVNSVCVTFDPSDGPSLAFKAEALTLTPGSNEYCMNFTWHSDRSDNTASAVQIAKRIEQEGGLFPSDAITWQGTVGNAASGKSWHKVSVSGLERNTEYIYRVSNDKSIYSEIYGFKTGGEGSFQFIAVGDPQLSTGNQDSSSLWPRPLTTTRAGWANTVNTFTTHFPDACFIAGTGDQVDNGANETLYDYFLEPAQLRSLPIAPTVGNHEGSNQSFTWHYNLPNETVGNYFGNYWYSYNGALFVVFNTSSYPSASSVNNYLVQFDATLMAATTANPDAKWLFVQHHKSTASPAEHQVDDDVKIWAAGIGPLMDKYQVDFVLAGHDHVYSRSWSIYEQKKVEGIDYTADSVINPQGTIYFTLNTASGLYYYDIPKTKPNGAPDWVDGKPWYTNVATQIKVPQFTVVDVSSESVTFKTYRTDTMAILDQYTVIKKKIVLNPPSISHDVSGNSHIFPSAAYGYANQGARTIMVTNEGGQASGNLDIVLGGVDPTAFSLSTASLSSMAAGGSRTFTVHPVAGLAPGTYSATVTVSPTEDNSNQLASISFSVSFTVGKAAGASVNTPTVQAVTQNSITVNAVIAPNNGQNVEYNISTSTNVPANGWVMSRTFNGLSSGIDYYVFVRSAANENYDAGAASRGAAVRTLMPTHTVIFSVINGNGTIRASVDSFNIVSGAVVEQGKNIVFTATPDIGYRVKAWRLNNTALPGNTSNSYTLSNLTTATVVSVEFEAISGNTIISITPTASIDKMSGNQNKLNITVTEKYANGETKIFTATFIINNNAVGTYNVGAYKVYIATKGGDKISECRIEL
ncbi:MAG: metallophosphoesterase [Firmicutes bacterium]|nr:metallophosphoesterase [Bacillota bacterium]